MATIGHIQREDESVTEFFQRVMEDVMTPPPPALSLAYQFIDKLHATYSVKNENYGNSFFSSLDAYGLISSLTRISDKFHRLEHLVLNNKDGGETDESLQDTLLDMACYCIMSAVYLEGREHGLEKTHLESPCEG